jgi:two-component system chemotaxis response regulator CheY
MKTLVVEDEFISRNILLAFLSEHGHCDVAINGCEAVEAFARAYAEGSPYDLVCLDLSMPEMNGHDALRHMRFAEVKRGIYGLDRVRIVITTVHWDAENMFPAFRGECDGYLAKPISKQALDELLCSLNVLAR